MRRHIPNSWSIQLPYWYFDLKFPLRNLLRGPHLFQSVQKNRTLPNCINCISASLVYTRLRVLFTVLWVLSKLCFKTRTGWNKSIKCYILNDSKVIFSAHAVGVSLFGPGAVDSQTPNSHQCSSPAETSQAWSLQQSSAVMCHDQVSLRGKNWTLICSLTPRLNHIRAVQVVCERKIKVHGLDYRYTLWTCVVWSCGAADD